MNCKRWSIGRKISFGFGIILAMLLTIGILSYTGVNGIIRNAAAVIEGNRLDSLLAQREVDHLNWAGKITAVLMDKKLTKLEVETDDHKCAFGKWLYGEDRKEAEKSLPGIAPLLKQIEEPHRKLHESAIEIGKRFHQADMALGNFLREKKTDHLVWANKVKDAFVNTSVTSIDVEMDPAKCGLGKWMYSKEVNELKGKDPQFAAVYAQMEASHSKLHETAREVSKLRADGKHDEARLYYLQNTGPLAAKTLESIDHILAWHDAQVKGMQEAGLIYATATVPALEKTRGILGQAREEARKAIISDKGMLDAAQTTKSAVGIIVGIAMLLGILIAVAIAMGISKCLRNLSRQIEEAADQVAAASDQVASSSQQLAEGASEQAASIEETSSSLDEMSSVTKANAENANQANLLMTGTKEIVSRAGQSMEKLTLSMGEVSKASEETFKIIKTIDEIAFQTNLLALNAAVEAARAGEAGAGFAVVADEVRNLAMRAAEAAKNTADLIEGTVRKIKEGSELVDKTEKEFREVADSVGRSGGLVGEITAASLEQAHGIEQTNKAVSEMEKVVQQNASNAEESACASEEMNSQAEKMKGFVEELRLMVDGSRAYDMPGSGESFNRKPTLKISAENPSNILPLTEKKGSGPAREGNGADLPHYKSKESQAEQSTN